MLTYESLPYRPCVGVVVLNRTGRVFIGKRRGGPEHVDDTHSWQMPQGGVDPGEEPWPAAQRELYEETNIRSVEKLAEVADWLTYDIPREIDIAHPDGGHEPEFGEWRWEPLANVPELVVPFKRPVYERVAREFVRFASRA